MTLGTGIGKACCLVIRRLCPVEILLMAGNTFISDPIPTLIGFVLMTLDTIEQIMCTRQRKTRLFMKFRNVIDQPVIGCMATFTVISHGHLMDVLMTGDAIWFCFVKDQILMTLTALGLGMLSFQRESGGSMVVFQFREINFPSTRIMTDLAIHLKIRAMGLCLLSGNVRDQEHHQHQEWQSIHFVFFVL